MFQRNDKYSLEFQVHDKFFFFVLKKAAALALDTRVILPKMQDANTKNTQIFTRFGHNFISFQFSL